VPNSGAAPKRQRRHAACVASAKFAHVFDDTEV
jgi:hypothetical protein